jgi:hypothetical protein
LQKVIGEPLRLIAEVPEPSKDEGVPTANVAQDFRPGVVIRTTDVAQNLAPLSANPNQPINRVAPSGVLVTIPPHRNNILNNAGPCHLTVPKSYWHEANDPFAYLAAFSNSRFATA